MHEVVVLPSTVEAAERQEAKGRPAWRISSTLFAHVASAHTLRPLGGFETAESLKEFPPITAGEQVTNVSRLPSILRAWRCCGVGCHAR